MHNEDGWIVIGADLSTKKFDSKMKKLEGQLQEKQNEKIQVEFEITTKQKEKIANEETLRTMYAEQTELYRQIEKLNKAAATPKGISTVDYTRLEEMNAEYDKMVQKSEAIEKANAKISKEISNQQKKYNKINQNISDMKDKLELMNFEKMKGSLNNVNSGIKEIVSNVKKWVLAVFGIRSAYTAIRQAMSTLSQYDEQMATNIEYIRYAIANMLKPVVEYILNLVIKILTYVNYLANAWFGINLFSRGSANNFAKAKDNLSGANKEAGKLKKTLAGFDEMNILGDSDTGAASGGISEGLIPSFDLSLLNIEVPKWLKWMAKNGKTVAIIIGSIGAALLTWKLGNIIAKLAGVTEGLIAFKAGMALVAAGGVLLISEIINIIYHWDEMSKSQKTLAVTLAVLGAAMITLGTSIALGLSIATLGIGALIAGIVALITAIGSLIIKQESNHKSATDLKKANEDLKKAQDDLKNATDEYISAVENAEEAQKQLKEAQDKTGLSGEDLYNKVKEGTLNYKDMDSAQREVYKAYINNTNAQERLKEATDNMTKATKEEEKATWNQKIANEKSAEGYNKLKGEIIKAYSEGKISAKDARDYIERCMADMDNKSRETFTKNLPGDIKDGLNPDKYSSTFTRFKNTWNNFWSGLATKLNMNVNANVKASSTGYAKGGIVPYAKGGVVKCASGAVVSRPGRGIPIAGESGIGSAEGVIPLNDSQQMQLLGEAIGRYITINANITNTMNGRVISRELQKVQNENDFAFNK